MRVLIVKTSSMGDIIHTLPALTDAINANPLIKFDWVVEEAFTQIPSWHRAVDRVIPVAIRRWRKSWFQQKTRDERKAFINNLQQVSYSKVIDAQGLIKSAFLITRLAKGEKHGFNWQSAREPIASIFYNKTHFVNKQQHAVERTRQLFAQSLGYPLPAQKGDYAIANYFLTAKTVSNFAPYVVFFHATTRDEKHWPESHWQQLIHYFAKTPFMIKLPWSNEIERQRANRLAEGFAYVEVLPKLSLHQLAEVIVHAASVISVDTGLSHLTAALSCPNITLYGPTNPGLIGGYGDNQQAITSRSGIMADISAESVFTLFSHSMVHHV